MTPLYQEAENRIHSCSPGITKRYTWPGDGTPSRQLSTSGRAYEFLQEVYGTVRPRISEHTSN